MDNGCQTRVSPVSTCSLQVVVLPVVGAFRHCYHHLLCARCGEHTGPAPEVHRGSVVTPFCSVGCRVAWEFALGIHEFQQED